MANAGMGVASAAAGTGVTAKVAGAAIRGTGALAGIAAKAAGSGPIGLVVAAVVTGIIASKAFIDWMYGPGGWRDVRFRRVIQNELDPFIERREKQMTNVGLRTVRVTSIAAVRGTSQVHSTQDMVKRGLPIYNGEFEAFSKGLFI